MLPKILIFFMFLGQIFRAQSEICNEKNIVDIKKGTLLSNGDIYIDGLKYDRTEDYVNDNVERGCQCMNKICVKKCCEHGYMYEKKKCAESTTEVFDPPVFDKNNRRKNLNTSKLFHYTYEKVTCRRPEIRLRVGQLAADMQLRTDGKLYIELPNAIPPWMIQNIDKYCIDTFIYENEDGSVSTKLDALVCFPEEEEEHYYVLSSTCMLISCVFILATLGVYIWLPELRNLHGRVLMAYLICLLIAFSELAAMQIMLQTGVITMSFCTALTICIYFFLLSAFFWLNIMCFDIWWTFSGKRGVTLKNLTTTGRFYAYATYAFGIPAMLTVLLVGLEFSGLPQHPLLPMLRDQGCFIAGKSRLLYLYGPILFISISNMVFFVLTATKIAMIKHQTSVLKSKESATHDQQSKEKQRFLLYVKLFIVMGINWILEVISAMYPNSALFWRTIDAYNVLTGVLIFIIFVCKKKIFHLIKKRMHVELRKTDSRDDVGPLPHDQQRLQSINNYGQRASLDTIRTFIDTNNCVVNQCPELRPTLAELCPAATTYD